MDDLVQPHAVPPSGIPAGALLGNPEHAGGGRIRKNSDIAVSGEHPVLRPVRFSLSGQKSIRHVCAAGLFTSMAIELMQLLTLLGECELDDVISNTFGAFIGVCLYQVAEKCWKDKEKNRVKN